MPLDREATPLGKVLVPPCNGCSCAVALARPLAHGRPPRARCFAWLVDATGRGRLRMAPKRQIDQRLPGNRVIRSRSTCDRIAVVNAKRWPFAHPRRSIVSSKRAVSDGFSQMKVIFDDSGPTCHLQAPQRLFYGVDRHTKRGTKGTLRYRLWILADLSRASAFALGRLGRSRAWQPRERASDDRELRRHRRKPRQPGFYHVDRSSGGLKTSRAPTLPAKIGRYSNQHLRWRSQTSGKAREPGALMRPAARFRTTR